MTHAFVIEVYSFVYLPYRYRTANFREKNIFQISPHITDWFLYKYLVYWVLNRVKKKGKQGCKHLRLINITGIFILKARDYNNTAPRGWHKTMRKLYSSPPTRWVTSTILIYNDFINQLPIKCLQDDWYELYNQSI